ncbi:MAG: DUF349 domain-containing protein [Acidobacteria bacterium]|nr:DUF349 domain-containing protein [Acidobacteriota bacterium]
MGILDKLRPQARWKHGDPMVRLEAVQALDASETDVLVQVASEDSDARVRRAAVGRLADAEVLAAVTRNDSDTGVRDAAVQRIITLASEPGGAAGAVRALGALGRHKDLAGVARSTAPEPVRHAAVAELTDARLLGGVARHAIDASTRLLALERLTDAAELEAVAVNGEHADAAVAAFDKLSGLSADQLGQIAQRAKSRAVAKRARALAAAMSATPVETAAPAAPQYREVEQATARELCQQMQALAANADVAAVRDGYAAARVAWVELNADADIEPSIVSEFEALSDTVRTALAADEAARAQAAKAAAALRREQAERVTWCERVEGLPVEGLEAGLADARAAWEALPPMPESWAADLQRRFDDAVKAAERRREQAEQARELRAQAPAVIDEIEALVAQEYAAVRGQWQALRRKWQAIQRTGDVEAALNDRFQAAAAAFETREAAVREGKQKQQQENLQRLQAAVQALEARAAAEAISLKDADAIVKDVKLAVGTMGPLPTPQDREDLTVRLQAVRAAVQPRLDELRNAEEWKRWANVQVQEELCGKMEALIPLADTDPAKASEEMRQLQEKWKPVAAAPRSQGEALWTRFKAAQSQVYEKCKDYFSQQAAERQEALKKKEELCARAEALSDSTDWVKTAEAMKTLQAEWKAIGPVTRGREKAIWERFRKACDAFFTRRQADMKQRKQDWGENLSKKEALIAEAEQLAQSTSWEQASARLKALQVEWKTIGPVKKSKSDQVWERFRAACDLFFERFKNRDQEQIQTKFVDRDTAVAEIEALVPDEGAAMPDDLYNKVQAARARWLQGPELPRHVLTPLAERVNAALLSLVTRWPEAFTGGELDPSVTARRMEKLCAKVEALVANDGGAAKTTASLSPAELLAKQWREALAANTMGAGAAKQAEEARQRAADQELRSAQSAWLRLGPVAPDVRKPLQERFDKAVRRVLDGRRRPVARA